MSNNQIVCKKMKKSKGMLHRAMEQMVEECVTYVSEANNQHKLHTAILGPTITYFLQQCYPYLLAFTCIFVINFVLTLILLIFVLRL